MLPITLGTPEQFATVKAFLNDAGFTATAVAERTGVAAIYLFKQLRTGRTEGASLDDVLDLLIRLFMDAEIVDWTTVRRLMPPTALSAFQELGLLRSAASATEGCHTSVLLYPAGTHAEVGIGQPELHVVSDLNADAHPEARLELVPDVVYPAVTLNTGVFLSFLPGTRCQNFLEVCGGTGIAALLAARVAERAWAADISPRSAHYAEFNIRLNALGNVVAVCGDLYQPVSGLTFDRIMAHPPYIPASQQQLLFRDGGDDGEQITRRVIAGLPEVLRPGGRFYCTCRATDRKDARLEQRVRQWLGEREGEFDILLVTLNEQNLAEHYGTVLEGDGASVEEVRAGLSLFRRLEAERFVYGTIVVQRVSGSRPTFTERRPAGAVVSSAAVEWLLDWETTVRQPGSDAWLLAARPRVSERADLQIKQRRANGGWQPVSCTTGSNWPFLLGVQCPLWAVAFLDRCDGKRALGEHLETLRAQRTLPAEGGEETLLGGVRALVSAGIIELERFPLPPLSARVPRAGASA